MKITITHITASSDGVSREEWCFAASDATGKQLIPPFRKSSRADAEAFLTRLKAMDGGRIAAADVEWVEA